MKKIIRKFLKRFGYIHISEQTQNMTVIPLDDKFALVSNERSDELYHEAWGAVNVSQTPAEAVVKVSEKCTHKNELAMAVYYVAGVSIKMNDSPISKLMDFLKK